MENFVRKSFFSRNPPFIGPETQIKLAALRVSLIGVGLSSQIAHALVRVGVTNLDLWDHDSVEISNLNRQAFSSEEIGCNKAGVTADHVRRINANLDVRIHERRFLSDDLDKGLEGVDVVVNSADFSDPIVYEINDAMQRQGGWCIQPLNLGFGGSCMIFGPDSPSLSDMTSGRQDSSAAFVQNLLDSSAGFRPSPSLLALGEDLLTAGDQIGYFPQNIIAALITTSLVTWAVVQIASENAENIIAPRLLHFEAKV